MNPFKKAMRSNSTDSCLTYQLPVSADSLHQKRIDIRVYGSSDRGIVVEKGTIHLLNIHGDIGSVIVYTDPVYVEPGLVKGVEIHLTKEHIRFLKYTDDLSSEETFTCYDPEIKTT